MQNSQFKLINKWSRFWKSKQEISKRTLLFTIAFLFHLAGHAQKIIRDTILTLPAYDEICETIMVCECIMPDSTYKRLKGILPNELTGGNIKYRPDCYFLGWDYDNYELHGFKDFELYLGKFKIEFGFPQYAYRIEKSSLTDKSIRFVNVKNEEEISLDWIRIKSTLGKEQQFDIKKDGSQLLRFIEKLEKYKTFELLISPTKYPDNGEICGNVLHKFPPVKLEIY
ncbi:hypothetical protein [Maribacter sp.]|uniref:hypothetical protein n=1 Tax=Maribacter sp. TaxID=1897614 RepID=UPI0025BD6A5E|nr:hypothetical protein [Maribacter sp.]